MDKVLITLGMATAHIREVDRLRWIQAMLHLRNTATQMLRCFGHTDLKDDLMLAWIMKVYIAPRNILFFGNDNYIYIAFDYFDKGKLYTTHFRELISLN